jgi:hypothetical protein
MSTTHREQLIGLTVTVTARQFTTLLRTARGRSLPTALAAHLAKRTRAARPLLITLQPARP